MTFHISQNSDHVADLLPAYLNGTLDALSSQHAEQHLLTCETCRNELAMWQSIREVAQIAVASAPLPSANVLSHVWEKIAASSQQTVTRRELLNGAIAHFWLVLKRQVSLLPKSIWIGAALVILFGCGLTLVTMLHARTHGYLETSMLALMTTISAAAGVAFIYGVENDAGFELTLATPTSMRMIMLCRLLLVVGYNFALAASASALIAIVHGGGFGEIVQAWLGPMLLLSSITLTFSLMVGSWFAILIGLILEASQALLISFGRHAPIIGFAPESMWQTTPAMLLLAVLLIVFAVLYVPGQPQLMN